MDGMNRTDPLPNAISFFNLFHLFQSERLRIKDDKCETKISWLLT
jgi:hypothetical protein